LIRVGTKSICTLAYQLHHRSFQNPRPSLTLESEASFRAQINSWRSLLRRSNRIQKRAGSINGHSKMRRSTSHPNYSLVRRNLPLLNSFSYTNWPLSKPAMSSPKRGR